MNCRLARAVVVPDAIPPERLERYGAGGKLRPYAGLKEEYYLADFEPDPAVLGELGLDPAEPIAVVAHAARRIAVPPVREPALRQGARAPAGQQAVVLPRTEAQRREVAALGGLLVPSRVIDAQSLIAFADLVISAGGTMNREAVALGTPVFTTFEGRLGAVDEGLLRDGRLRKLEDAGQVRLEKRPLHESDRIRRDPRELTKLLLSATER